MNITMDFIQQVQLWAKEEVEQGKWMLGVALVLLSLLIVLLRSENALLR